MLAHVLWIVASLVLLSAGAEGLVRGASALARRIGMSPFTIGLTVVGFGTSSPELFASLTAGLNGQADLAVGNVVGSNIFNVLVILGLTALVVVVPVPRALLRGEAMPLIAAALVPFLALAFGGVLPQWLGVLLVLALVLYVRRAYRAGREAASAPQVEAQADHALHLDEPGALQHPVRSALYILAGLALLVWGADMLVEHAVQIARALGVSELAIGLTIVAGGTSMPELVTSMVGAYRGHSEIAVGNVVGSNVFNVLGVLGLTTAITPQAVAPQVIRLDTPVMLGATLLLLGLAFTRGRITRPEGVLMLLGFVVYTWVLMS